jgi:O-acetyl-ADP-ribose deacetylase (regulator of RNase III)
MEFVSVADGSRGFPLPEACQAMSHDWNEYATVSSAAGQWILRRVYDSERPINLSFDAQLR